MKHAKRSDYYRKKRWKKHVAFTASDRSSSDLILVRLSFVILFENRFLDPHFLSRFLLAIGRRKGRGIAGKTIRRTGVTGLWFVLTVYLHRARRSGLLARRARARACDFACREADHYDTRFLVDSTFLQLHGPLQHSLTIKLQVFLFASRL